MTTRFVHTSSITTKDAMIAQLSYILEAYSIVGVTQKELAQRIGCSTAVLSRIKNFRPGTSLDTLLRIADTLDVEYTITTTRSNGAMQTYTEVESAVTYCIRKDLSRAITQLSSRKHNVGLKTPSYKPRAVRVH